MGGEAAVQVAVRVRLFNGREKRMDAKRCIDMEGPQTHVYEDDGFNPNFYVARGSFDYIFLMFFFCS